jgi:glycosyltransferase involved in cell wall biosynthesis
MISVIMAAYNAAQYIEQAIESILNQTYKEFELIIVDDGSTDRTLEIARRYAAQDSRVRVLTMNHGGVAKARNLAIEAAHYPWIAAIDADDIALPERLEKQLRAAEREPDVVVWGTYLTRIDINGGVLGTLALGPTSKDAFYAIDRTKQVIELFNPTAMFRRDIALKVGGYDPRMVPSEDSELWDRMSDYGPVMVLPEPLLLYRLHDKSLSMTQQDRQKMLHRFPIERRKAASEGQVLTLDEFVAHYHRRPSWERFTTYMLNRSKYSGKMASIHLAQKRYVRAGVLLALAVLFHPRFMLSRLWTDRILHKVAPSAAPWTNE